LLNDNKITGCKNVLLLIVSGEEEITIDEIGEINDFIQSEAGNNTNIIMGVGEDPELGDKISVTIIATGFNSDQQHEIVNTEVKKVIHTLEEDQSFVHDLTERTESNTPFANPISNSDKDLVVKHSLEETDEAQETNKVSLVAPLDQKLVQEKEYTDLNILLTEELLDLEVVFEQISASVTETIKPIIEIEVESGFISPMPFDLEEPPVPSQDEEFVINELLTDFCEIEVIDAEHLNVEEKNQISFEFDLPIMQAEAGKSNTIEFEQILSEELTITTSVNEDLEQEPSKVFQLDQLDLSEEVEIALPAPSINDIEVEFKLVSKDEVLDKVASPSDVSPFDRSIDESVNFVNEKRKEQLKKFNYTFKNNINRIEEMEKQPAYKRMGFDVDGPQEEGGNSQISLDTDTNHDIQFRSNNSFLHDNVD